MARPGSRRLALVVLATGVVPALHAEELRIEPSAGAQTSYNDNPTLVADDAEAVFGVIADAGLAASWGAEQWRWSLAPKLVARRYDGETDLDSLDTYVTAGYARALERGSFDLGVSYAQEYTLTSNFVATGVVDENVPRQVVALNAAATRQFGERLSLLGQLGHQDVSYDGGLRWGLRDYDYWSASGSLQYGLRERTQASLVLRLAQLEVPLTEQTSRELSLGLGVDHEWSERWSMGLSAGPSFSDADGGPRSTGYSYRATLDGDWERATLTLGGERVLSPDAAQGRLQTRDVLRGTVTYRHSHAFETSAYVRDERYSDVADAGVRRGTSYGTLLGGFSLRWRPDEAWSWVLSYTRTIRDTEHSPSSNSLGAGLVWRGRARSSSH